MLKDWSQKALDESVKKLNITADRIRSNFPTTCFDGKRYEINEQSGGWVSGYWSGILWMLYRITADEKFKNYAKECEKKLDALPRSFKLISHDIGFMWLLTSKPGWTLLHDEMSKSRLIFMANMLAGRFNIKGNFIRAWEGYREQPEQNVKGWAIIDCTMNLPLLFVASELTGDPRFSHVACAHADTVLQYFLRADGSVNHICEFSPETGAFIKVHSGQGYAADSAWARGASWCIHGLALCYGFTGQQKYLEGAMRAADFFWENLPEDKVCYWDLRAPLQDPMPRDTSAAANAASGMLTIAKYLDGDKKAMYTARAEEIVKSLWDTYYIPDTDIDPLLSKSTVHYPAGIGIDCSVIYADYYFLEALYKLSGEEEIYNW